MSGQLKQGGIQVGSSRQKTGKGLCAGCAGKLRGLLSDGLCMVRHDAVDMRTPQAVLSCEVPAGSSSRSIEGRQKL